MPQTKWEEEWDKFRKEWAILNQGGLEQDHSDMVKQFISSLRQQDCKALIEKIPDNPLYDNFRQLIKDYYKD